MILKMNFVLRQFFSLICGLKRKWTISTVTILEVVNGYPGTFKEQGSFYPLAFWCDMLIHKPNKNTNEISSL